jgi:hypothetical protein
VARKRASSIAPTRILSCGWTYVGRVRARGAAHVVRGRAPIKCMVMRATACAHAHVSRRARIHRRLMHAWSMHMDMQRVLTGPCGEALRRRGHRAWVGRPASKRAQLPGCIRTHRKWKVQTTFSQHLSRTTHRREPATLDDRQKTASLDHNLDNAWTTAGQHLDNTEFWTSFGRDLDNNTDSWTTCGQPGQHRMTDRSCSSPRGQSADSRMAPQATTATVWWQRAPIDGLPLA